jgi:hypothetical protein
MNLIQLKDEIAVHVADPDKTQVQDSELTTFVNSAARDATALGILVPIEDAETIRLVTNDYVYDVPPNFAC